MPGPNKLPPSVLQLPDLQVRSLELVGTQARIRVLNAGQAAAGPFNVQLLAAQPSTVSAIFATFDHKVGGVPPMTSIPVVIDVAPNKLTAGNVTVHLDSNNEVKESNETNNSASK
jgi:subtilase family serine protease